MKKLMAIVRAFFAVHSGNLLTIIGIGTVALFNI